MKMLILFKQLLQKIILRKIFLSLQNLISKRYSFGKKKFANLILSYLLFIFGKYGKIRDENEQDTKSEAPPPRGRAGPILAARAGGEGASELVSYSVSSHCLPFVA